MGRNLYFFSTCCFILSGFKICTMQIDLLGYMYNLNCYIYIVSKFIFSVLRLDKSVSRTSK